MKNANKSGEKTSDFFKVKTLITSLSYADYLFSLSVQKGKFLLMKEPILSLKL